MSTTAESAAICCAIMDAQMTSAEFDAAVRRNKLLHDCKTKGFKRLAKLGFLSGGITKPKKKQVTTRMSDYEFAKMGAAMVNSGKMTITQWANQCDRGSGDLRYWCDKYQIYLKRKELSSVDEAAIYAKARLLVNSRGCNFSQASRKCGVSETLLRNIVHRKGRVYNAKSKRIEKP